MINKCYLNIKWQRNSNEFNKLVWHFLANSYRYKQKMRIELSSFKLVANDFFFVTTVQIFKS